MSLPFSTPQYVYTSREERNRLLGEQGTDWHSDDVSDDTDINLEIDIRATARVNQVLQKLFSPVDMNSSPWVRERATIIGCYLDSIRRGNPSLYQEQYIEAIADMEAVVAGDYYLDLPRSSNASVIFQNVSSDNRFPFTPMRVDPITASRLTGQEFITRWLPFSWL